MNTNTTDDKNLLSRIFIIHIKHMINEEEWSDGARFDSLEKAREQVKTYLHLHGTEKYQFRIVCKEMRVVE